MLLSRPHEWDPSVLDYVHPNSYSYLSCAPDPLARDQHDPLSDEHGTFQCSIVQTLSILSEEPITSVQKHVQKPSTIDYNKLRPYFGWVNADTIQETLDNSTQCAVTSTRFPMRQHNKSRFQHSSPQRDKSVAPHTIFSDTPVIDFGVTMPQISVSKHSLVSDVCPMQSSKLGNNLEVNIRFRGAMRKLIRVYAQVEISNKVKDILRMYHSSSWHFDSYHQNRNTSECRSTTIKAWMNTILNRSGAPAGCWLLFMSYTCYLLNHISCESLKIPQYHHDAYLLPTSILCTT